MKFRLLFFGVCLLLSARTLAAQQQTAGPPETNPVSALFDEKVLAGNSAEVRRQALKLPDPQRFDRLVSWVLPSREHSTIRLNGEFTASNPAPVHRIDTSEEHLRGGRIVSPVFELLDLAKRSGRLMELLTKVDAAPDPAAEEQQRAKAALQTLIHLELGNGNDATRAADRLLPLVRTSKPAATNDMWPETLVAYRHVIRNLSASGVDEVPGVLFSQRTQLNLLPGELPWHSQIASLAGKRGHRESATPAVTQPGDTQLTQWIPISRRRALTRGQGLAVAEWARAGSQLYKISGHDDDYLFFRSPLTGDFEVQCDVTAFTTQTMTAGKFLGNDGVSSHLWVGTFRDSATRVASNLRFSGFDDWIHHRSVVRGDSCTTSLNGLVAATEQSPTSHDPWYAVRSWWRLHAAARDVRITGNPQIPEAVDLSASPDLRGWFPYFEESVGSPGAVWEHVPDEHSSGVIVGHAGAPPGTYCESLLAYQRPLDVVGSIDYEFLYEPGVTEVHPALDRMVFFLRPEGVRIHWLTDGPFDRSEAGPENLCDLPADGQTSELPLKSGTWNHLMIAVRDRRVTLHLNGIRICETPIDEWNDRVFGLFHFADQTDARVRQVSMRGSWPTTLPGLSQQEAADQRPGKLDADLPELRTVFTHSFSRNGVPEGRFFPGENQPGGLFEVREDGWHIHRPGGGEWLDSFVTLPYLVHGDFDIEIAFEDFRAIGDEFGCIMLVVELDDEKRQQCRILRIRDELQRQELHSSLSELHPDGGRSYSARLPKKTEATAGRLRMARRGTVLYYLFAENDASVYQLLDQETISASSSVPHGLHFHTMCSGQGETSVLWKSISIRAERLTLNPAPR